MSRGRSLTTPEAEKIEAMVGHAFANRDLVDLAMTHASVRSGSGGNYERFEFLGDRVLGLCVAELLFTTFPGASEGELSVRLNHLVSAETCASVADEMGLHQFIRTGADVKKITAKNMLNVRADVVESLIAALYLDAGLEVARAFVLRYWQDKAENSNAARRDAKTELQEWTHARFGTTPAYRVDNRSGPDHDPRFTVTVEIAGIAPETGIERSRRAAEQAAAAKILEREGVWKL